MLTAATHKERYAAHLHRHANPALMHTNTTRRLPTTDNAHLSLPVCTHASVWNVLLPGAHDGCQAQKECTLCVCLRPLSYVHYINNAISPPAHKTMNIDVDATALMGGVGMLTL